MPPAMYGPDFGGYGGRDMPGVLNETLAELRGQRSVHGLGAGCPPPAPGEHIVNETMADLHGHRSVHGLHSMHALPADLGGAPGHGGGPPGPWPVRGMGGCVPPPPPPPPGAEYGAPAERCLPPSCGSFVATPYDEGGMPRYAWPNFADGAWPPPHAHGAAPYQGCASPMPPVPPLPPWAGLPDAYGGGAAPGPLDLRGIGMPPQPNWAFPTPQIGNLPCEPLFKDVGFREEPREQLRLRKEESPPRQPSPPQTARHAFIDSSSFIAATERGDQTERSLASPPRRDASPVASYLMDRLPPEQRHRRGRRERESRWLPCIASC